MTRRRAATQPAQAAGPRAVWLAAILIAAGLVAYSNSFSNPFVLDDHLSVVENGQIRDLWNPSVLSAARELPTAGRPLVNLTFAINYALGGLDVTGYHLVNLAIHLLNACLVFGLVRRTLQKKWGREPFPDSPATRRNANESSGKRGREPFWVAFAAALVWTLHPLNTEAVDYVTQRTELMMAFFYLLTLYASVRGAVEGGTLWPVAAIASCFAGMACKESMVTAPVAVVLYDAVFVFDSPRAALATRWRFYVGLCASWILLAALNLNGPRVHSAGFSSGLSPWTYLLNQPAMIVEYLRRTIWPRSLVLNYGWPQPITVGQALPEALVVIALLAATIVALVRWPMWGFVGSWFFLTLAPTSSIVPIATEVGAERRMYLPLVALIAAGTAGLWLLARSRPRIAIAALALVAFLLGAATFQRNSEYVSELNLARTSVERHPSAVAHHMLANNLIVAGQDSEAMEELQKALPGDPRAHYTLGMQYLKQGRAKEATDQLQTFLNEQPLLLEAVSARIVLGQALVKQNRWMEALEQAEMVVKMNPSAAQIMSDHGLFADAYFTGQQYEQAIPHYRDYLRAHPDDVAALMRLGVSSIATDNIEQAIAAFQRAVDLAPADGDAQRNLATALYDHQEFARAVVHAEQAVKLHPSDPDAEDLYGRTLALTGRYDDARVHFERALRLNPAHADAREDLRKLQLLIARTK